MKERNILDPSELKPLLERSLMQTPEKGQVLDKILTGVKSEKEQALLSSVLDKNLKGNPETKAIMSKIIHDVRDEKESDILNPEFMRPILQKALKPQVVEMVLTDLKVKKDHGFILPLLEKTMEQFRAHLADDLNISPALAALFDMVREVNALCDQGKIGISEAEDVLDFLARIDQVLGVLPFEGREEAVPVELEEALKRRERARAEKNWKEADACRDLIQAGGYFIEDTPFGARLKRL